MYRVSDKVEFILYADDTNVFVKGSDLVGTHDVKNDVLNRIVEWFCANQLSFNMKRTQYMMFSNRSNKLSQKIKISDLEVKRVSNVKFLGIYIDDKSYGRNNIECQC